MKGTILVIGIDGVIGNALYQYFIAKGKTVLGTTRRTATVSQKRLYLNLTDDITNWQPPKNVTVAYVCAGTSSIAYCARNPAISEIVNVKSIVQLSHKLVNDGSRVVFLSTNLVFDGSAPFVKTQTPTSGQTLHGQQKAAAEQQLLSLGKLVSVLRSTKVFSPHMPLFQEWIAQLNQHQVVSPFSNKVIAPLPLPFIIKVLVNIATFGWSGILQISADTEVTYTQIAHRIADKCGMNHDLIKPTTAVAKELAPLYTTLETSDVFIKHGLIPPPVWDTIDWMISTNYETAAAKTP